MSIFENSTKFETHRTKHFKGDIRYSHNVESTTDGPSLSTFLYCISYAFFYVQTTISYLLAYMIIIDIIIQHMIFILISI